MTPKILNRELHRKASCSGLSQDGPKGVGKKFAGTLQLLVVFCFGLFAAGDAYGRGLDAEGQGLARYAEERVAGALETPPSPPSHIVVMRVPQLENEGAHLPVQSKSPEPVFSTGLGNEFSQAGPDRSDPVFRRRIARHAVSGQRSYESAESSADESANEIRLGEKGLSEFAQGWSWGCFWKGFIGGCIGGSLGVLLSRGMERPWPWIVKIARISVNWISRK